MSKAKIKVRGTQGSWLVDADIPGIGKVKLPTAHQEFIKGTDLQYRRTDALGQMVQTHPAKYRKWKDALLEHKMVVVTLDKWTADEGKVQRRGYVGIFEVSDIKISPDDAEHSFRIAGKVIDTV